MVAAAWAGAPWKCCGCCRRWNISIWEGRIPAPGGRMEKRGDAMPDEVPRALATLRELRVLKLGYSQIGAEGLHLLEPLDKLEKLMLTCCPRVGDDALAELAKWKSLRYLDVQETKVTDAGVATLRKVRPDMAILSGTLTVPPS